jgi:hypothetical protein
LDNPYRYREEVTTGHDYCDWCYDPIDTVDRQRSEEAGTDDADAWACVNCIESGRVYQPPESWEGDPVEWPVKDISDQLRLAEGNVAVVLTDIQRTTDLRPRVTVDAYRSVVRIAYDSGWTTPSVRATSNPEALIETADYLKDLIVEDEGWSPWPLCPLHEIGGVQAEVRDGLAVWWCNFGHHLVARVGQLGAGNS